MISTVLSEWVDRHETKVLDIFTLFTLFLCVYVHFIRNCDFDLLNNFVYCALHLLHYFFLTYILSQGAIGLIGDPK